MKILYFFKTPTLFKYFYPQAIWNGSRSKKKIFLTFDDGPIPEVTDYVLDVLSNFNIKATFFCVGENVIKYPSTFKRLIQEGHTIGNHTYNHLDGWQISLDKYLENIYLCRDAMVENGLSPGTFFFRPPYGKLKIGLNKNLESNFKIIMWDVLAYDFSPNINSDRCLKESIKNTQNGSIVLFHDSLKTIEKLKFIIPEYIAYFLDKNYEFCKIDDLSLQHI